MLIDNFRIINYKSYRDSGTIPLVSGFNVFVGKNNSGKTALLEALSLSSLTHKPHRHSGIPRGYPLSPHSRLELRATLTPDDLRRAFFDNNGVLFPIQQADVNRDNGSRVFDEFLSAERGVSFIAQPHSAIFEVPQNYPSHEMFVRGERFFYTRFVPNAERTALVRAETAESPNDSVFAAVGGFVIRSIYSFRAERLSLGKHTFADEQVLAPDANNLAVVLQRLQADYPRYARFSELVRRVFPSIRRISVWPSARDVEIRISNADTPEDRDDLLIPLAESGTGIGQVLAMLYVLVTSDSPRTIIIDEPNIFLHPGAIRELVRIMRADPIGHQYIITTHSPEIIRTTEAERVYVVERRDEQSFVEPIDPAKTISFRRTLAEVGARLSDLFGADHILWVEGPTEEECFPRMIRAEPPLGEPAGLAVIAVRATGDFEGRRASAVAIWNIYQRLSTAGGMMPATVAISLDAEDRSSTDIEEATRRSGGLIKFLPRRCFESYLIHPRAITALLMSLPTFATNPVTQQAVEDWLNARGGHDSYLANEVWIGNIADKNWLRNVHGARLLHDLFAELSQAKEEYRKVEHGAALTQWICDHDLTHFTELRAYITGLLAAH
jgi:AAA domain, putative AbiEii toxin, Type IV TA system/AAA ATPase domain